MRPLLGTSTVALHRGTLRRLVGDAILHNRVISTLDNVHSVRHLVAEIICNATGTESLLRLSVATRGFPGVGTLLSGSGYEVLGRVCGSVSALSSIIDLVGTSVGPRTPLAIHRNGVVGSNCDRLISALHGSVGDNAKILARVRIERGRHAKVGGLHIHCGGIFKCCVRIAGSFLSGIPSSCVEGRALAGTRHFVARRLGRVRGHMLATGSGVIRIRCRVFSAVHGGATTRIVEFRGATSTVTELSALASLTGISDRGRCYQPLVGAGNIVRVARNERPIIRRILGTPFISGSALLGVASSHYTVVANPGVTNGSACVHRITLVALVTRVKYFIPTGDTRVNIISTVFAHINTSSSLTSKRSAFVIRVDRITCVLGGTAGRDLLVLSRVNENASAFSNVSVTHTILRFIISGGGLKTGTLFTARCRRLARVRGRLGNIGGCGVTIGGHNSSVAFLHQVIHNNTSSDCNVRITGLDKVPGTMVRHTGRILHLVRDRNPIACGGVASSARVSFRVRSTRSVLGSLGTVSIGALAPVRSVRVLFRVYGGTGRV